jgi:hypothetical protein
MAVASVLVGASSLAVGTAIGSSGPAAADGPAPCTVGGPPYPFHGFCATYAGDNTWFGSYGPGFPTGQGWAFCADPPASGGDYPAPQYDYVPSGPPAGAEIGQVGPLGFAFSEAQANGWWGGSPGQFTSDQAAVAGKLLYDALIWSSPVPSMDPGVLAAFQAISGWFTQASGASGGPEITSGLVDGTKSFAGTGTYGVHIEFPGTDSPAVGFPIELVATGASFDSPTGSNQITISSDANGNAEASLFASSPGPVSVATIAAGGLGQFGLSFLSPTTDDLRAQALAAFSAPANYDQSEQLEALPTTGSISVQKTGDDTSYYPVAGAVFDVITAGNVVTTMISGNDGTAASSIPIPAGTYTVREVVPPPGYGSAPDQQITVDPGITTSVQFSDHSVRASVTIEKTDAESTEPLSGAVFDISYDSANDGTFDETIGSCTTDASGTCTPIGIDGTSGLLPGQYRVTEVDPPAGYALPTTPTQVVSLAPGEHGTVTFGDARYVSAVFAKTAIGNINPAELSLAGAQIVVRQLSSQGNEVASCTTDSSGVCTTPATLVSGNEYCWQEVKAPPGLASGANGCFRAASTQSDAPIAISDPGEFVAVDVRKVDAADPAIGLPGATFNLFRIVPPLSIPEGSSSAGSTTNEIWVGQATTDESGIASFPLQLPGYAYCALESQAPPDYAPDTTMHCTGVLDGSTAIPAPVTTITVADSELTVGLTLVKFDDLQPTNRLSGAVYDLYVQGKLPPSGATGIAPDNVHSEPGDSWYGRGSTGADGTISFTVPAGYSWCALEVTPPLNYVIDPALHCSGEISAGTASTTTISIPETLSTVHVTAFKYDSLQPDTMIPGATYELVAEDAVPPGSPASVPNNASVPSGDSFWGEATSDNKGVLSFAVPAGIFLVLPRVVGTAAIPLGLRLPLHSGHYDRLASASCDVGRSGGSQPDQSAVHGRAVAVLHRYRRRLGTFRRNRRSSRRCHRAPPRAAPTSPFCAQADAPSEALT